ncbi:MAG: histidinol phosphate phosphatase domain-containing protein [Deltaproteobacteria bacterium]
MIDLHTHSLLSDGVLLPSELIRRAWVKGYKAIAITDHADESNIAALVKSLKEVCKAWASAGITAIAGVELTHIPPERIGLLVKKARRLGADIVVGHGETLVEPVAEGTNLAYIKAGVDILAHPGVVDEEQCALAVKNRVFFELTSRGGHSLSNGRVAAMAKRTGVKLLVNTDAHAPGDLIDVEMALKVALGAGLDEEGFKNIQEDARRFVKKISS